MRNGTSHVRRAVARPVPARVTATGVHLRVLRGGKPPARRSFAIVPLSTPSGPVPAEVNVEIAAYLSRRGLSHPQPAWRHANGLLEIPVLDLGDLRELAPKQQARCAHLNATFPALRIRAVWLRDVRLVINGGGAR